MRIEFAASENIRLAIGRLGRTEDLQFSPDGRRLAIAGFFENRILLLDVRIDLEIEPPAIAFSDYLEVTSTAFGQPHGLFWIDDSTLVVANRQGEVPIFRIPDANPTSRVIDLVPLSTIRSDDIDLLRSPGSVSAARIGAGLYEVLICNNFENFISQHIIDERAGWAVVTSSTILKNGLEVPDGIARSQSGRWIAVSNHYAHSVFLYRNDDSLNEFSGPCGTLQGVKYPHGVRFSQDGRFIFVADAGEPFVHVFASEDGNWCAERRPAASIQVVDDASFAAGHHNPEEGGPKGIDLCGSDGILAVSCEEEPIVFFDVRKMLGALRRGMGEDSRLDSELPEAEASRAAFLQHLSGARATLQAAHADFMEARDLRLQSLDRELQAVLASRSWRATRPLRWLGAAVRKARHVLGKTRRN